MKKAVTFLLIGILIGTIFGSFFLRETKAELDEIYYLKKICDSLSDIESKIDSINFKLSHIMCSINWIRYWIKYCSKTSDIGGYNEH